MSRQGSSGTEDLAFHRGSRRLTPRLPLNATIELREPVGASGTVLNVSKGGMRVLLDRELSPGTFLLAKITVEGSPEVTIRGRIVWTRSWVDGCVMGIAYDRIQRAEEPAELPREGTVIMAGVIRPAPPPADEPMAGEETLDEHEDDFDIDIVLEEDELPASQTVVLDADEVTRSARMPLGDVERERRRKIRESGTIPIPSRRRVEPPSGTVVIPLEELAERTEEEPLPAQRTLVLHEDELPRRKLG